MKKKESKSSSTNTSLFFLSSLESQLTEKKVLGAEPELFKLFSRLSDSLSETSLDVLKAHKRRIELIILFFVIKISKHTFNSCLNRLSARILCHLHTLINPYDIYTVLNDFIYISLGHAPHYISSFEPSLLDLHEAYTAPAVSLNSLSSSNASQVVATSTKDLKLGVTSSHLHLSLLQRLAALEVVCFIVPAFPTYTTHCLPHVILSAKEIATKLPSATADTIECLIRCIDVCGAAGSEMSLVLEPLINTAINSKQLAAILAGIRLISSLATKRFACVLLNGVSYLSRFLTLACHEDDIIRNCVAAALAHVLFAMARHEDTSNLFDSEINQGQGSADTDHNGNSFSTPTLTSTNSDVFSKQKTHAQMKAPEYQIPVEGPTNIAWEILAAAPLCQVVTSKEDTQPLPLLIHPAFCCTFKNPLKNLPESTPAALVWMAAQIAHPPINILHKLGAFSEMSRSGQSHQRLVPSRVFCNSEVEYNGGVFIANFRETLTSAFLHFCRTSKFHQPKKLGAVLNLVLSITTCEILASLNANSEKQKMVSTYLSTWITNTEALQLAKQPNDNKEAIICNPLLSCNTLAEKLNLLRGRGLTLESMHLIRCVVELTVRIIQDLARSELARSYIIEHVLPIILENGVREFTRTDTQTFGNEETEEFATLRPINAATILINLYLIGKCSHFTMSANKKNKLCNQLIKCIANPAPGMHSCVQRQAAAALYAVLLFPTPTANITFDVVSNLLSVSHVELLSASTDASDSNFMQNVLCRVSGYTLALKAILLAQKLTVHQSERDNVCLRTLELTEAFLPSTDSVVPKHAVVSASRRFSAAILFSAILTVSSTSWQLKHLGRLLAVWKLFMGKRPIDALRALSELESAGGLTPDEVIHLNYLAPSLQDAYAVLQKKPCGISVSSNLTDELLVLLEALQSLIVFLQRDSIYDDETTVPSSIKKTLIVLLTNTAQLTAFLPHPLTVLATPPTSHAQAEAMIRIALKHQSFLVNSSSDSDKTPAPYTHVANSYGETFLGQDVCRGVVSGALRSFVYRGLLFLPSQHYVSKYHQILNAIADDISGPSTTPCGSVAGELSKIYECRIDYRFLDAAGSQSAFTPTCITDQSKWFVNMQSLYSLIKIGATQGPEITEPSSNTNDCSWIFNRSFMKRFWVEDYHWHNMNSMILEDVRWVKTLAEGPLVTATEFELLEASHEYRWKHSSVLLFGLLMSKESIGSSARLAALQHFLRTIQRPPPGPFTLAIQHEGETECDTNKVKKDLHSIPAMLWQHSKIKRPFGVPWSEAWLVPSARDVSQPRTTGLMFKEPFNDCLDKSVYLESTSAPFTILLAIREFLFQLIPTSSQLPPSTMQSRNVRESTMSISSESSSPQTPLTVDNVDNRASIINGQSQLQTSPVKEHVDSKISSLTLLESQNLFSIVREAANSPHDCITIISAECNGLLGALGLLTDDRYLVTESLHCASYWNESGRLETRTLMILSLAVMANTFWGSYLTAPTLPLHSAVFSDVLTHLVLNLQNTKTKEAALNQRMLKLQKNIFESLYELSTDGNGGFSDLMQLCSDYNISMTALKETPTLWAYFIYLVMDHMKRTDVLKNTKLQIWSLTALNLITDVMPPTEDVIFLEILDTLAGVFSFSPRPDPSVLLVAARVFASCINAYFSDKTAGAMINPATIEIVDSESISNKNNASLECLKKTKRIFNIFAMFIDESYFPSEVSQELLGYTIAQPIEACNFNPLESKQNSLWKKSFSDRLFSWALFSQHFTEAQLYLVVALHNLFRTSCTQLEDSSLWIAFVWRLIRATTSPINALRSLAGSILLNIQTTKPALLHKSLSLIFKSCEDDTMKNVKRVSNKCMAERYLFVVETSENSVLLRLVFQNLVSSYCLHSAQLQPVETLTLLLDVIQPLHVNDDFEKESVYDEDALTSLTAISQNNVAINVDTLGELSRCTESDDESPNCPAIYTDTQNLKVTGPNNLLTATLEGWGFNVAQGKRAVGTVGKKLKRIRSNRFSKKQQRLRSIQQAQVAGFGQKIYQVLMRIDVPPRIALFTAVRDFGFTTKIMAFNLIRHILHTWIDVPIPETDPAALQSLATRLISIIGWAFNAELNTEASQLLAILLRLAGARYTTNHGGDALLDGIAYETNEKNFIVQTKSVLSLEGFETQLMSMIRRMLLLSSKLNPTTASNFSLNSAGFFVWIYGLDICVLFMNSGLCDSIKKIEEWFWQSLEFSTTILSNELCNNDNQVDEKVFTFDITLKQAWFFHSYSAVVQLLLCSTNKIECSLLINKILFLKATRLAFEQSNITTINLKDKLMNTIKYPPSFLNVSTSYQNAQFLLNQQMILSDCLSTFSYITPEPHQLILSQLFKGISLVSEWKEGFSLQCNNEDTTIVVDDLIEILNIALMWQNNLTEDLSNCDTHKQLIALQLIRTLWCMIKDCLSTLLLLSTPMKNKEKDNKNDILTLTFHCFNNQMQHIITWYNTQYYTTEFESSRSLYYIYVANQVSIFSFLLKLIVRYKDYSISLECLNTSLTVIVSFIFTWIGKYAEKNGQLKLNTQTQNQNDSSSSAMMIRDNISFGAFEILETLFTALTQPQFFELRQSVMPCLLSLVQSSEDFHFAETLIDLMVQCKPNNELLTRLKSSWKKVCFSLTTLGEEGYEFLDIVISELMQQDWQKALESSSVLHELLSSTERVDRILLSTSCIIPALLLLNENWVNYKSKRTKVHIEEWISSMLNVVLSQLIGGTTIDNAATQGDLTLDDNDTFTLTKSVDDNNNNDACAIINVSISNLMHVMKGAEKTLSAMSAAVQQEIKRSSDHLENGLFSPLVSLLIDKLVHLCSFFLNHKNEEEKELEIVNPVLLASFELLSNILRLSSLCEDSDFPNMMNQSFNLVLKVYKLLKNDDTEGGTPSIVKKPLGMLTFTISQADKIVFRQMLTATTNNVLTATDTRACVEDLLRYHVSSSQHHNEQQLSSSPISIHNIESNNDSSKSNNNKQCLITLKTKF